MKKAKILAISSIFALLMCACANDEASSKNENGGFDYTAPTITYDGVEESLNLKGNTKIKEIIDAFPADDATAEAKKEFNTKLIKALAANDIAAKKVEGTVIDYNKIVYEEGKLDTRNFETNTHFIIERNNESQTLHGTFEYDSQKYEEKVTGEPGSETKTIIASPKVDLSGTYDVGVITVDENRKIEKKTTFKDNLREEEKIETGYNVSNFQEALKVYPLVEFKNAFLDKLDDNPIKNEGAEGPSVEVNYDFNSKLTSTKEADGTINVQIVNTLANKASGKEDKTIRTDKFQATITKEGAVSYAYHLREDVCTYYPDPLLDETTTKSLIKFEEKYTFSF